VTHGRRRTYQAGCRCGACVRENAAYQARYRASQRTGVLLLGARVNGKEARARVRALQAEHVSQRRGLAQPWNVKRLRLTGDAVTLRTLLRLRRLTRRYLCEDCDVPHPETAAIRR
jgi:hypothetical protein